jgi:hypothetical protein
MPDRIDELINRYEALKKERQMWEAHWQEISELVLPRRSDFVGPRTKGDKRGLKAVDSTAIIANELLAAGLHGMLTNPASKWFKLRISDESLMTDEDVLTWLEDVERIIFSEFNSSVSGFTSHIHELYLDLCAFGTAVMFIGTDEKDQLIFSTRHLKECYLAEDPWGQIDTVYRLFEYTIRNVVIRWPDTHGAEIKKLYEAGKLDQKVDVLHCTYPRTDPPSEDKTAAGLPFASEYIIPKHKIELQVGGFDEKPYVSPRWIKAAGETFGRGPGMNTLPDVKMLQEMLKTVIKSAQKIVDPPLQAEDDSVVGPVRTVPGGLNFRRAGSDPIIPLETRGNIPIGLEMLQDARVRIREGFFIDQLQLNTGPQMTATEVLQRTEEKLRLLGPVLGRLQSEFLSVLIDRVFGILSRTGKLPIPPSVLENVEYTVEYVSPLARAQRQVEANGLMRVFEIGGPIFQIDPNAPKALNGPAAIHWLADLFGLPVSITNTPDQVAEMIRMEQEAIARQQQMAALQQGAGAAKDGTAALETLMNTVGGGEQ